MPAGLLTPCRAAGGLDLVDHGLGRRLVCPEAVNVAAEVVDHHLGALARGNQRLFASDPAAAAGDQNHFPFEQSHRFIPSIACLK
jgi:hypothetical protein